MLTTTEPQLLALLQLTSPSLPIGAFAYSQGLEAAVESGWVKDADSLRDWLSTSLNYGLANLELPLLIRLYQAWQDADLERVGHWQDTLLANRETAELVQEELQIGRTFARLLNTLDLQPASTPGVPLYLSMYAYAAMRLEVPLPMAMTGWIWSWLENQVMVACKTVPLGQTPAQQILLAMHTQVPEALKHAQQLNDAQIGMTLPALTLASGWHEHQYSRLFRS